MDIENIKNKLKDFSKERNWDKYHTPKNLAMALSVEASELVEIFQWLNDKESDNLNSEDLQSVKEEISDILIYLIRIADKLEINIEESLIEKLKINEQKYPIDLSKNNAVKYNKRKIVNE